MFGVGCRGASSETRFVVSCRGASSETRFRCCRGASSGPCHGHDMIDVRVCMWMRDAPARSSPDPPTDHVFLALFRTMLMCMCMRIVLCARVSSISVSIGSLFSLPLVQMCALVACKMGLGIAYLADLADAFVCRPSIACLMYTSTIRVTVLASVCV